MMRHGGTIEVEGNAKSANRIFPFSKPSPFSSMTDWHLGTPTNNEMPPTAQKEENKLNSQEILEMTIHQEIAKFEKTMDELHVLRKVSRDLRNFRKMISLKQYD